MLKICKEQGVPVEERRVRRKKRMAGENAGEACLIIVEEVRRCMFEALDRYKIEAERRFNGITQLNDMFAFLNPHELLQNKNHETCLNALRSIYEDDIDFSELIVEIDRFKRLVRRNGTTFERNATAIDVLQWLTNCRLLDSTPHLCLCFKLYLTIDVSTASCEKSFSKLKLIK